MLTNAPVVTFLATTNPVAARAFFQHTLGLRLVAEDGFALTFETGGAHLRVTTVVALTPAPFTVLGWTVSDIASSLSDLTSRGVHFEHFSGFGQDERGIWTAPDGALVAWFKDPGGNVLSLTQPPDA